MGKQTRNRKLAAHERKRIAKEQAEAEAKQRRLKGFRPATTGEMLAELQRHPLPSANRPGVGKASARRATDRRSQIFLSPK
jgi:hypothetical protein